mmetsp:Transcript_810/g.1600  ORF Transcript_810/g.1600 Transcript_810/m.1600 type:complete len:278 (-) Transcript_810:12-845(-)
MHSVLCVIAPTSGSPPWWVTWFRTRFKHRSAWFCLRASANATTPVWSLPAEVMLLDSRSSMRSVALDISASASALALLMDRLFPSSSSFRRFLFTFNISASATPSSSLRPFLERSIDSQVVLFSSALARRRTWTEPRSIPTNEMSRSDSFFWSWAMICPRPPSIFSRCSSSSLLRRSCSSRSRSFCCRISFCCAFLRRSLASSASFCLRRSSRSSMRRRRRSSFCFCSHSVRAVCGSTSTGARKCKAVVPSPTVCSSWSSSKSSSSAMATTRTQKLK